MGIYNFLLLPSQFLMHRKILHGECRTWLIHDIVVPLVCVYILLDCNVAAKKWIQHPGFNSCSTLFCCR